MKKAFWAAHAAFLGAFIAPLVAMYGDVVAQVRLKILSEIMNEINKSEFFEKKRQLIPNFKAALYTGGITAGISTLGWCAPSKEFMNLMGPASMIMGAVFIAALASPFFRSGSFKINFKK